MDQATFHLEPGTKIKERWEVVYKIGQGGCGAVYEMRTINGNERAAMKVEAHKQDQKGVLKMEVTVMKALEGKKHVTKLLACGQKARAYSYLVMDLLGPNLSQLRFSCPNNRFTTATTIRIGIQCLESVRDLHQVGFVHRDIKPGNFAIGASDDTERIIYMLDFGLARQYVQTDKDGKKQIREPRQHAFFRGTVRYCSYNVHKRVEQGRHDDLFSWMYMLVELMGGLPWTYIRNRDAIAKLKETISTEQLLEQCPAEFEPILAHIKSLSYRHEPKYALIDDQLKKVMQRKGYKDEDPYDWQEGGAYFQHTRMGTGGADDIEQDQEKEEHEGEMSE